MAKWENHLRGSEADRIAEIDALMDELAKERRRIVGNAWSRLRRIRPDVKKKQAENRKNWRAQNPEKYAAQQARYRERHPEVARLHHARYAAAHPEKRKITKTRYMIAKRVGVETAHIPDELVEAKVAQLQLWKACKRSENRC